MSRTEKRGSPRQPDLKESLVVVLGLTFAAVSFAVALVGKPTWPVRVAALVAVVVTIVAVVAWHSGYRAANDRSDPG
jgi:membrane protein YdbS with pleckstrin-like domain